MAHPTLISNHVGTNLIIISERNAQHSHMTMWEHLPQPCQKVPALTSVNQCQKGSALTLGHVRNQSSMLKGSALISKNQCQKGSTLTSDNQCQKGSALILDTCEEPIQHARSKGICTYIQHMRGTNTTCMFERACTHIWSSRNQSYSHIRMAPSPRLSYLVTDQATPFLEWNSVLISNHVGTNPIVTLEWLNTHIWHGRNQSSHHDSMAQPLHLTMEGTNPLTMSEWL